MKPVPNHQDAATLGFVETIDGLRLKDVRDPVMSGDVGGIDDLYGIIDYDDVGSSTGRRPTERRREDTAALLGS
jgi:hypothetical protein